MLLIIGCDDEKSTEAGKVLFSISGSYSNETISISEEAFVTISINSDNPNDFCLFITDKSLEYLQENNQTPEWRFMIDTNSAFAEGSFPENGENSYFDADDHLWIDFANNAEFVIDEIDSSNGTMKAHINLSVTGFTNNFDIENGSEPETTQCTGQVSITLDDIEYGIDYYD